MRRLVSILTVLVALLLSSRAYPCDTQATATPASTCVEMARDGKPGAWLGVPALDELIRAKSALPHAQAAEKAAKDLAEIRAAQVRLYEKTDAAQQAALQAAQAEVQRQAEERARVEAELHAWYRSPWLWAVVGGVTTAAGGFVLWRVTR